MHRASPARAAAARGRRSNSSNPISQELLRLDLQRLPQGLGFILKRLLMLHFLSCIPLCARLWFVCFFFFSVSPSTDFAKIDFAQKRNQILCFFFFYYYSASLMAPLYLKSFGAALSLSC